MKNDIKAEANAKLEAQIDEVLEHARERISVAMDQDGQYTHNMISATLRQVANEIGIAYANELIEEFDLTELYDIYKVK